MTGKESVQEIAPCHDESVASGAVHNETFDISEDALGNNLGAHYYRSPAFIGTVVALVMGYNSVNLGFTLSANSLTRINADIGPSPEIVWVSLTFTLSLAVCFLPFGRLTDIFGRRWFIVIGNLFAAVGCAISGSATNINTLIGGNTFIGIAATVQISPGLVIEELVPKKHRAMWVAFVYFTGALPFLGFGPVIAQQLADNTAVGWRWCFYLGVIAGGLSTVLFFFFYHPPKFRQLHQHRSRWEQVRRLDFIGLFFYMTGLFLFITGLNWGGNRYPWKSAQVIATIIVGFFCVVIFVFYDSYVHKGDALMPLYLFKSRGFTPMLLTASVGATLYYSMAILWPQQVAYLFTGSPLHKGWLACVLGFAVSTGLGVAGPLIKYVRYHKYTFVFVNALMTIIAGAMTTLEPGQESKGIGLIFTAVFAAGFIECGSIVLIPFSCPDEDLGTALGVLGSVRSAISCVGVAIFTTILSNKLTTLTPPRVEQAAVKAGLSASSVPRLLANYATNITNVPGMDAEIAAAVGVAVTKAAADSFRYVWYSVIAFGIVAVIASFFTIDYGDYFTNDIARKLQNVKRKEMPANSSDIRQTSA